MMEFRLEKGKYQLSSKVLNNSKISFHLPAGMMPNIRGLFFPVTLI